MPDKFLSIDERLMLIWREYEEHKTAQRRTIRSGFGEYGCYSLPALRKAPYDRVETDAEHCFGCSLLGSEFNVYFSELYPDDWLADFNFYITYHELDENKEGDIPDDGREPKEQKNQREREATLAFSRNWPEAKRQRLLRLCEDALAPCTYFGGRAKVIDKVEAILQGLIFERHGYSGDLGFKEFYYGLSARDREFFDTYGSAKMVDNWFWSFYENYHTYDVSRLGEDLIRLATADVRNH